MRINSQLTVSDVITKEQAVAAGLLALDLLGEHKCVYTQTTSTPTLKRTHSCLPEGHSVSWERRGQGVPNINREQRSKMTGHHCPVSVRL